MLKLLVVSILNAFGSALGQCPEYFISVNYAKRNTWSLAGFPAQTCSESERFLLLKPYSHIQNFDLWPYGALKAGSWKSRGPIIGALEMAHLRTEIKGVKFGQRSQIRLSLPNIHKLRRKTSLRMWPSIVKPFPFIYPALLLIRDLLDLVGLVVFQKNAGGVWRCLKRPLKRKYAGTAMLFGER